MSYAVIRTGGKQYRVTQGELLRVESLPGELGSDITFSDVLFTSAEGAVQIGTPLVPGASVTARVESLPGGLGLVVFKKKRRKGYRRKQGHRQHFTAVQVKSINLGG